MYDWPGVYGGVVVVGMVYEARFNIYYTISTGIFSEKERTEVRSDILAIARRNDQSQWGVVCGVLRETRLDYKHAPYTYD